MYRELNKLLEYTHFDIYQKTLLHTLLLIVLKIIKNLQCILEDKLKLTFQWPLSKLWRIYRTVVIYRFFTGTMKVGWKCSYNHVEYILETYKVPLKFLIWRESLTLLFSYLWQDNYKIIFLARRLGAWLLFDCFIFFHPNFLLSFDPKT